MLTRRAVLSLPLSMFLPAALPSPGATRRALIVGINQYLPPAGAQIPLDPAGVQKKPPAPGYPRMPVSGDGRRQTYIDLDGAVNDAALIQEVLMKHFQFDPRNIVMLTNRQATADRILSEFKRHLVDAAASGDVSVFFFAGHGSQIKNSATPEVDTKDETFVTADSYLGTPDIRDKEMSRLYHAAAKKGVLLTVVLDCCFSGGMTRGSWNATGKYRGLPPDPRVARDPGPDRQKVAAELGVLFLTATREDQRAGEDVFRQKPHGNFTAALVQALESSRPGQSVQELCDRVQALVAGKGQPQVPMCAGAGRDRRGLLGLAAEAPQTITVPVQGPVRNGVVQIRGGSALGLSPGCELVHAGGKPVRLLLTSVDFGMSVAKILTGSAQMIEPGDLFRLDMWAAPEVNRLRVYFPSDAPEQASVVAVADLLRTLASETGIEVLADVAHAVPTHVLSWLHGEYVIETHPASASPVHLGPSPERLALLTALGGAGARLWPILPPHRQLIQTIGLGAGSKYGNVEISPDAAGATYILTGRVEKGSLEYEWILKDVLSLDQDHTRMPIATRWETSGTKLTELAVSLARIYGWINLESPSGAHWLFPYELTFEKAGAGQPAGPGPFKFGEQYKIVFRARIQDLQHVENRYVYVFLIDSDGEGKCLFPPAYDENVSNLLPRDGPLLPRVEASRSGPEITIEGPEGVDNYIFVTSRDHLDPNIFVWPAIGSGSAAPRRSPANALEILFMSLAEPARGDGSPHKLPVHWSVQSLPVRSIP